MGEEESRRRACARATALPERRWKWGASRAVSATVIARAPQDSLKVGEWQISNRIVQSIEMDRINRRHHYHRPA